jgi:ribosomal protein S21
MNKQSKNFKTIVPGAGVAVKVLSTKQYPKGDINFALKSFKKELKESGKMEDLKNRRHYVSRSQKRKEEMDRAKYHQWLDDQNQ